MRELKDKHIEKLLEVLRERGPMTTRQLEQAMHLSDTAVWNRVSIARREGLIHVSGYSKAESNRNYAKRLWAVGDAPDDMTLERLDVNGDYEPSNCTWATQKQQQNNRRNNRRIVHDGLDLTATQWAEKRGWNKGIVLRRIWNGWDPIDAITREPRKVSYAR